MISVTWVNTCETALQMLGNPHINKYANVVFGQGIDRLPAVIYRLFSDYWYWFLFFFCPITDKNSLLFFLFNNDLYLISPQKHIGESLFWKLQVIEIHRIKAHVVF